LSFKIEMPRESRRRGPDEQDMVRLVHYQSGCSDRVDDSFDRSHRPGPQRGTVHNRGVHPHHAVQLSARSTPGIEKTGGFQEPDRAFNRHDGGTSLLKDGIASGQCLGETGCLHQSHGSAAGAAVDENDGARSVQLRRRSRARW
jgi:hypothetical protein